jgi:hypothetical protein
MAAHRNHNFPRIIWVSFIIRVAAGFSLRGFVFVYQKNPRNLKVAATTFQTFLFVAAGFSLRPFPAYVNKTHAT